MELWKGGELIFPDSCGHLHYSLGDDHGGEQEHHGDGGSREDGG